MDMCSAVLTAAWREARRSAICCPAPAPVVSFRTVCPCVCVCVCVCMCWCVSICLFDWHSVSIYCWGSSWVGVLYISLILRSCQVQTHREPFTNKQAVPDTAWDFGKEPSRPWHRKVTSRLVQLIGLLLGSGLIGLLTLKACVRSRAKPQPLSDAPWCQFGRTPGWAMASAEGKPPVQFPGQTTKYVVVVGGVCSSLGKGVTCSSMGAVLKAHGYSVTAIKIDPYVNVDAGLMSPFEHGEVQSFPLDGAPATVRAQCGRGANFGKIWGPSR